MYTNAGPHIGFALEMLQADAIARWRRMRGDEVTFLTGTDEHGTKIARAAADAGQEPRAFVDDVARQVWELAEKLGISNTDFIRTTDRERHWPAAQKFWQKLAESGDLYKKSYEGFYCVGHEAFIRESELEDGRCPLHKRPAEKVSEENWFFALSRYTGKVRELIASDRLRIVPATRKQEVLNLLDDADDVSFSRPAEQLSWGIPVPGDDSQTMYVWADALTNYISAVGYAAETADFRALWPADVHLIGKDILRFHAILWPAMLLSAGLEVPKAVYVHGFINVEGQKMSKSLGNIISPADLIAKYDPEAVRYFLLREIPSTDDGDFSWERMAQRYESDLANALGNLVQRVATLVGTKLDGNAVYRAGVHGIVPELADVFNDEDYHRAMEQFRLHDALGATFKKVDMANAYINAQEPWKKGREENEVILAVASAMIGHIARLLGPFMPRTAERIAKTLGVTPGEWKDGTEIRPVGPKPLFPRG